MSTSQDRGLRAIERVRGVRERDSRIGLQQAVREQDARELVVAGLEESLTAQGSTAPGNLDAFVAQRGVLQALGRAIVDARTELGSAVVVRTSADAFWQSDKTRLSAVETLLEHRSDERREMREREAAKASDEAAGQLWLRRTAKDVS